MKKLFWLLLIFPFFIFSQDKPINYKQIDVDLLNKYILEEVNLLRKKKKVAPLKNESLLEPAANDHSSYMQSKDVLTHYQKNKIKKTPKNRVDFYGEQFDRVGENVQLNHTQNKVKVKRKEKTIETYAELAKSLVYNWEHSPPHYRNIITPEFKTTYTTIKVGEDGKIYACQLFGRNVYERPEQVEEFYEYKPYSYKKCKRCLDTYKKIGVHIDEDSVIYMYAEQKKDVKKLFIKAKKDGVVADIVLREQFLCGKGNQHNGKQGVDGFLLGPVFKKDFNKNGNIYKKNHVWVRLGKVPSWVDQQYEVNLSLINNNRTCMNIVFYQFRTDMQLDLNIDLDFDTLSPLYSVLEEDSLKETVYYKKGAIAIDDSVITNLKYQLLENGEGIAAIEVKGFSSIEGSSEINEQLYLKRAENLLLPFKEFYNDSSPIDIRISANENYEDFRKDIVGTEFEYLNKLSNIELKEELKDTGLVTTLEPLLSKHRFSQLTINYQRKQEKNFSVEDLKAAFVEALKNKNISKALEIQKMMMWYFKNDSLPLNAVSLEIPMTKESLELKLNNSILKFHIDTLNPDCYANFESELNELLTLAPKNKLINNFIAVFDFLKLVNSPLNNSSELFKSIKKRKYIDNKLKARLLIAIAYYNDIILYNRKQKEKLIFQIKKYLKPAKLTPNEQFDVARYYSFYLDYKMAYEISRKALNKTEEINNWVYFLKLIHISKIKDNRKLYLKYFKKVKQYAKDDFCNLFHTTYLNFQILNDDEIKKIYCETCE